MTSMSEIQLQLARSMREESIRAAARERRFAMASSSRGSIRRSIGFSIIRIGQRQAAEVLVVVGSVAGLSRRPHLEISDDLRRP